MSEKEGENNYILFKIMFILVILSIVFELIMFGISLYYAEEVSCNLLYCKFSNSKEEINIVIEKNTICKEDGIVINCSKDMILPFGIPQ